MATQTFTISKPGTKYTSIDEMVYDINSHISPEMVDALDAYSDLGLLVRENTFSENTITFNRTWDDASFADYQAQYGASVDSNKAALEAAGFVITGL